MSSAVLERPGTRGPDDNRPGVVGRLRGGWDRPRIVVVIVALIAGVVTVVLSATVFSHLSVNNDETVYLLQAKAYASGHFFPPAGDPASSFTPWLGVIRGDHYVLKYTPVVPSVLALSLVLTGGYAAALAAWAMAFVGATFILAKEATGSRTAAAVASVFVALTPLTMIQGALALPYVPFAVLAELALWSLLVGLRRQRPSLYALAGLLGGLAFMARAFDALLMLLPTAVWVLWRCAGRRRSALAAMIAGTVPPAAFLLWFDYVSTGSPLRQPFSLFAPTDTLGFGVHRLFSTDPPKHFGIAQGWQGLWAHLRLLGQGWGFGAAALLLLVVIALVRRQVPAAAVTVLAGGVVTTLGYLFFWGIWNAAIVWGATRYIGPYYLMPLVGPASIVAAVGVCRLFEGVDTRRARYATGVVAVAGLTGVGFSVATLVSSINVNGQLNNQNRQLAQAIDARGRSLIFVDTAPSYLQHPSSVISNGAELDGRTLYALDKGAANFTVLDNYPGRQLWALRLLGEYGKKPKSGYGARLQALALRSGPQLTLDTRVTMPAKTAEAYLQVTAAAHTEQIALAPDQDVTVPVTLAAGTIAPSVGGLTLADVDPGTTDQVTITLVSRKIGSERWGVSRATVAVQLTPQGQLEVLAPTGPITSLGPAPDPTLGYEFAPSAINP
jgi:4-amino-4-deoxy-L-arabinose transferase-like glycosyltransferase